MEYKGRKRRAKLVKKKRANKSKDSIISYHKKRS
jgi:hypothetical protein